MDLLEYVIFSLKETIANDGEPMFWNNEDGWGSLQSAFVFSEDECVNSEIPLAGDAIWVALPQ